MKFAAGDAVGCSLHGKEYRAINGVIEIPNATETDAELLQPHGFRRIYDSAVVTAEVDTAAAEKKALLEEAVQLGLAVDGRKSIGVLRKMIDEAKAQKKPE
jgi:hypothetical protein